MKTKNSISDDIQKEIALRAYYIWEREGRPEGREHAHWTLAEAEVLSERPAKKAAAVTAPAKPKANGAAKKSEPAKAEAKTEPAKQAAPLKAAVAAKAVKTKKAAKPKKPAPKA